MTQITASNQITIDYSYDRWRLIQEHDDTEAVLMLEVSAEKNLRYNKFFATTRDLPETGELPHDKIVQVVLGWSYQTEAWQLGLTLTPDIAESRESRWFELVRFVDPDRTVSEYDAKRVGQALADVLQKPFVDAPPETPPEPEPIPLPELPLTYGIWSLDRVMSREGLTSREGEIYLMRSKSWLYGELRQVAWYGFWAIVYTWVSTATISSDLALPNAGTLLPDPSILPYIGLGIVVLLLGMILRELWIIRSEPDNLIISPYEQSVTARRGRNVRWKVNAYNIQSIYVTEMVKKREKRPFTYHGEINVLKNDGSFHRMIVDDEKQTEAVLSGMDVESKSRGETVIKLTSHEMETTLQAMALHISECLENLPVYHDLRYK